MSANIDIITAAFRKANIIPQIATPSGAQAQAGLDDLNRMMAMWEENGIFLQYYRQTDTAATFPCAEYTEQGVIGALAISLCSGYGRVVSAELGKYAGDGMSVISRKAMNKQARPVDVSHLPPGAGYNNRGRILEG